MICRIDGCVALRAAQSVYCAAHRATHAEPLPGLSEASAASPAPSEHEGQIEYDEDGLPVRFYPRTR